MADLRAGDTIFDEHGQPTSVLHAPEPMYGHLCYDVVFSDGSVITADAGHLWETLTSANLKAYDYHRKRTGPLIPVGWSGFRSDDFSTKKYSVTQPQKIKALKALGKTC